MKFIFSDCLDMVDPGYDFLADRSSPGRYPYWDDIYPHEILESAPYDGVLVSRAIVGDRRIRGKYTDSQAMRFRRVGARAFLRLEGPNYAGLDLFGDCGAFSYVNAVAPPYEPDETVTYYEECGFTHACSVDHIIFDFDTKLCGMAGGSAIARERFDITQENAHAFLAAHKAAGARFTPLGVVQGWSPDSMAEAARRLVAMGYSYLAVGGMVPLKTPDIRAALAQIRATVPEATRLHVLGFAKADEIDTFRPYRITSFDSTSPLLRAFKDARQNYYLPSSNGKLQYFTAIRVPQSIENPRLQRLVKMGVFHAEDLTRMEADALGALRAFDQGEAELEDVLQRLIAYSAPLLIERPAEDACSDPKLARMADQYRITLGARPWKSCDCGICRKISIEVIIFRASNRNKRRGIHNLAVYKNHIREAGSHPCQ
ncbi:hypothetical protein SAMN02982917_3933 [Azospirillum oryzae]|uniref:tRNA-guanine family transglycosylase n=1 Tax=Azospirillum oryzae TaxID=286727 RepID=A0A1X7GJY0_9PROT|nr:tRNA-guanine transglycosylase DpdA [Azospirillum oryzae]SMF70774.1 hypothetical protein SAMN02982917_3933 [Azospirillum oryzae]